MNVSGLQQVLIASAVLLAVFAVLARRLPVRLGTDEDVTADDYMVRQLDTMDGQGGDVPSRPAAMEMPDGRYRVSVGYRVRAGQEAAFQRAMQGMRESRLRNGASRWQLRQMPVAGGASVWEEVFLLPSAAEWQRFPERMTQADRIAFEGVLAVLAPASGAAAGEPEAGTP